MRLNCILFYEEAVKDQEEKVLSASSYGLMA